MTTPLSPTSAYPNDPRKKSRTGWWILLILAVFLALCIVGLFVTVLSSGAGSKAHKTLDLSPTAASAPYQGVSPATSKASKRASLAKSDLQLTVKITKKDCFGSAGCLVEYKISAAVDTDKLKATGKQYDVTYDVKGLEDTQTGTLTLNQDGTYDQDSFQSGQTRTTKVNLSAIVVSVDERL